MFEPGFRGETKCSLGDICCSHVLEKGPNERRRRSRVDRVLGEKSVALLSSCSVLACTIRLITRQEDAEGCSVRVLIHVNFH